MNKAQKAIVELSTMDDLARKSSPFHRLHPICKLLLSIFYIVMVTSIHKYDLYRLISMMIFPIVAYQFAYIDISECFVRLRYVLPLVMAVGLINPFVEKETVFVIGSLAISKGMISMITLMLKGILSLMASFLFVATTPLEDICAALSHLHVPNFLVALFMLTYRYVSVLLEEVATMSIAYSLRAPKQKGIHFSAWGSFLGQLILRSFDRANRLFDSMMLRGFQGSFDYSYQHEYVKSSFAILACGIGLLVVFRVLNIVVLLGSLF